MKWKLNFQKNDILEVKAGGVFTNEDFLIMAEKVVLNPKWRPGMSAVVDFRKVSGTNMSLNDLLLARDIHMQFDNVAGKGKIAVIVAEKTDRFLLLAYEAIASMCIRSKIRCFEDYKKGIEWLCR